MAHFFHFHILSQLKLPNFETKAEHTALNHQHQEGCKSTWHYIQVSRQEVHPPGTMNCNMSKTYGFKS